MSAVMFAEIVRKNTLAIAKAYGEATGMSLSQVSKRAYGNATFLNEFKAGTQSVSVEKLDRMLKWFRQNWPEKTDWPFLPVIHMTQRNGKRA